MQRLPRRHGRPAGALNCDDLARELLRRGLFGPERGAFAGAVSRTAGLLARLAAGPGFMDEIGEFAAAAQATLLQFVHEREGRRVAAPGRVKVDAQLTAATHYVFSRWVLDMRILRPI